MSHQSGDHTIQGSSMPYWHFAAMLALNFAAMYLLMYSMVNVFGNVYNSFNEFYMAGLMTAPMAVFEMLLMRGMYQNKTWNWLIVGGGVIALAVFFLAIRAQFAVGDTQFLRSMIPHHSGAILMCEKANLQDPEIKQLCQNIIVSQQQEIDHMKSILDRVGK